MNPSDYTIYDTSEAAWNGMYEALKEAKKSIYWELYIFVDDDAGTRFFDLLEEKAKAGVDVKVIVDALGSFGLSRKRVKQLRGAGVDLHIFHARKQKFRTIMGMLRSRTHRKILVINEEVGFIGGVNIQSYMKDWLDIHVRLTGKVVHSLLRAFAKSYILSGGKKTAVKHLLQYPYRLKTKEIQFIYDDAGDTKSQARQTYMDALAKARERVILFSPYYLPGKTFFKALWQAKQRGVRVDLLIPLRTDIRIATYAAYAWFRLLEKMGVHIHVSPKMMHGKGVIVDDDWAMVGSSNLTKESFFEHFEANVLFKDKSVVIRLKKTVQGWLDQSLDLDKLPWRSKGKLQRLREWFAQKLYGFWHLGRD